MPLPLPSYNITSIMSETNQATPTGSKSAKTASEAATQQPTPPPEADRIKADEERRAAERRSQEIAKEAARILGCPETSPAQILGVEANSAGKENLSAWRHLGCLLHKTSTTEEDSVAAFQSEL